MGRFFLRLTQALLLCGIAFLAWWWWPMATPTPPASPEPASSSLPPSGSPPQLRPDPTFLLPPAEPRTPVHILFLGVDERPDDPGRSDTMLLVRAESGRIRALSLPRDTRVQLPEVGDAKLNAAYAYGGPKLAKSTVSSLLGLPVSYYVKVNLAGFRALVDLIGGVPYQVESAMRYEDPYDGLVIDLQPGYQVLDGDKAEQYVRFRYDATGDDLSRIRRQQSFLKAAAHHALRPSNLTKLPNLLYTASRYVETDLPFYEQMQLAKLAYHAQQSGRVTAETLPGEGAYVGEISYFLLDQKKMEQLLQHWRGE